ncbi:MAG: hypothetical protein RDV41_04715 [Planctomycetota bacterium]|nr:hypothetical protein [Planctomycetota bacterium]
MKRLALLFCLALLAFVAGCTYSREHNKRHWLSMKQDLHEMHRWVDKYWFNFDWDDPNRY